MRTRCNKCQEDKTFLLTKTRPHLQTQKLSWNKYKLDHESRRGPKPTMTVQARAISNLLDWTAHLRAAVTTVTAMIDAVRNFILDFLLHE
jgi:hypothetical protein